MAGAGSYDPRGTIGRQPACRNRVKPVFSRANDLSLAQRSMSGSAAREGASATGSTSNSVTRLFWLAGVTSAARQRSDACICSCAKPSWPLPARAIVPAVADWRNRSATRPCQLPRRDCGLPPPTLAPRPSAGQHADRQAGQAARIGRQRCESPSRWGWRSSAAPDAANGSWVVGRPGAVGKKPNDSWRVCCTGRCTGGAGRWTSSAASCMGALDQ